MGEGRAMHSYEYESPVSPLTPWLEGYDAGMSFSPVSPLIDESPHWAVGFEPRPGRVQHLSSFPQTLKTQTTVNSTRSSWNSKTFRLRLRVG